MVLKGKVRKETMFLSPIKRSKNLSAENTEAKKLFMQVRDEYIALGQSYPLTVGEMENFLNPLVKVFQLSSHDQWAYFEAKKLYLDLIRTFAAFSYLSIEHRLSKQRLYDEYLSLTHSPIFNVCTSAERRQMLQLIGHLQQELVQGSIYIKKRLVETC